MTQVAEAMKEAEVKSGKKAGSGRVKPEALGITFQGILDLVPESSKYQVLAAIVSSISCSVIGTASTLVGRFERMENVDLHTLETHEVLHMMMEADMRQDLLRNVRSLVKVREALSDQLLAVANDDDVATWQSSIEFMTRPAGDSRIDKARYIEAFRVCGIEDEQTLEIMYQASLREESNDRKRNAELIAMRQGSIEWFIERIFHGVSTYNENGTLVDDEHIVNRVEDLPADIQNRIYDKLRVALNKALQRTAGRFAVGDTRYEITDMMMINDLLKDAKKLEAFTPD